MLRYPRSHGNVSACYRITEDLYDPSKFNDDKHVMDICHQMGR